MGLNGFRTAPQSELCLSFTNLNSSAHDESNILAVLESKIGGSSKSSVENEASEHISVISPLNFTSKLVLRDVKLVP